MDSRTKGNRRVRRMVPPSLLRRFIFWSAFLCLTVSNGRAAQTVTLLWRANSEANLEGYKVHHGPNSRIYTDHIDVGNVTTSTISNLVPEQTYFMAVTAYDSSGLESDPSNEIIFAGTGEPLVLEPLSFRTGIFQLTLSASPGQRAIIQTSTDLVSWISIQTNLLTSSRLYVFLSDTNTPTGMRFFRAFLP